MPIINAADFGLRFPAGGGVADISPITNAINRAIGHKVENDRIKQADQMKLMQKAAQTTALALMDITKSGNLTQKKIAIARMAQDAQAKGEDIKGLTELLASRTDDELTTRVLNRARMLSDVGEQLNERMKAQKGPEGMASAKTEILEDGTVIQALPDGDVEVRNPLGNIVTGQDRLNVLEASQNFRLDRLKTESGIAIKQAREVAGAKAREGRISDLRKEMSTSNRLAARGKLKLNQTLGLIDQTTGGVTDKAKLRLSKLFPGMDVSSEGALVSSFRSLALDELQKFKGPTTDFEFGIAESIGGVFGDPKTANRARIKSLQRNGWFVQKEFEQFNNFIKAGGDPDSFAFNFGEPVGTKKGVFTLQQIQDTAVERHLSIEEVLEKLNR